MSSIPPTVSRKARRKLRFGPGGTVRYRDEQGIIGITSAESAHAYVAAQRADWGSDGILVFRPADHRCRSASQSARRLALLHGDGLAPLAAIAGLPVIKAKEMLYGKWVAERPADYWEP